ncbi:hypothetical protein EB796_019701 [Bugula neritina]|uniref:Uncharacterized protein n=1 Tax=Bugula neritina TaxID=10212 RepID=A0A7J7J7J2_BUGNE|nr:hypothetical protein EB796_019701 [Bugula neritina]
MCNYITIYFDSLICNYISFAIIHKHILLHYITFIFAVVLLHYISQTIIFENIVIFHYYLNLSDTCVFAPAPH